MTSVKIYIETYGCTMNQSDSEAIAGLLVKKGHIIVNKETEADIIIINTCSVKTPTENKILKRIKSIKKPLIVAGCLAQVNSEKILKIKSNAAIVGPHNIESVINAISQQRGFNKTKIKPLNKPLLNKKRKFENILKIAISEGCLGNCTYCQTKIARGKLYSFPKEDIVNEIKTSLPERGVSEIWLTSQDTASYGIDSDSSLTDLIKEILSINADFRLRLGMMNPWHLSKQIDSLLELMKDHRMFKFLHIPVQSGSNSVLTHMKRPYDRETYISLIEKIKSAFPNIHLSTDIIVGYPTETEEEFQMSCNLIEKTRPQTVNISRFMSRKGTEAEKLKALSGTVLKNRSRILNEICKKIRFKENKTYLNTEHLVLVDGKGSKQGQTARTNNYKLVIVPEGNIGSIYKVKIVDYTSTYLIGEIIS